MMNEKPVEPVDINTAESDDSDYREEALREYAKAHQSFNLTRLIPARAWILLMVIGLIMAGGLTWFFCGTLVTRVSGQGILVGKMSSLNNVSFYGDNGYVTSILVEVGQKVTKDQILGTVHDPNLANKAEQVEQKISELNDRYQQQVKQAERAIAIRQQQIDEEVMNLKKLITQDKKNAVSQRLVYDQKALSFLKAEFELYKEDWEDKLLSLKLRIAQYEKVRQNLQKVAIMGDTIRSPVDGYVFSIQAEKSDFVSQGQVLFHISPYMESLIVQAYIPANEAKAIRQGMPVEVIPGFIEPLEYGAIRGVVSHVSEYPESVASMTVRLKNRSLVKKFFDMGPVIAVKIELQEDKHNFSGLAWTSSRGPHLKLTQGTLVNLYVVVERRRPVSYILPRVENLTHDDAQ